MKPTIKQKIAFFNPTGFLDGENAAEIISPFDIDFLLQTKPEGAFISLKRVVFFNKKGISVLLESLIRVREQCGTIVGFCDYDLKKYKMILEMFATNLNFSLFDTTDIVTLYLGDDLKNTKEKNIVIYVEKSDQKNQLAMELFERGYSPVVAKDENDFIEKRKNGQYIIEHSYLGKLNKTPKVFIKDNVIVYTLKGFVDSDMAKKFDMEYHNNSLKVGFNLFLFDSEGVSSINVHGANFISKLSTAGAEYGATFVLSGINTRKLTEKLQHDLEDAGVIIYANINELFNNEEMMEEVRKTSSVAKKHGGITKKLISILPVITSASVKTIEVLSGYNAQKKSLKVEELNVEVDKDLFCTSIGFYGDIEGVLILVIEKNIARKACDILLNTNSNDNDLKEALGEFIYIVGGKIVQQLYKQSIKIEMTMPRTFDKIEDLISSQKGVRGAQVDLEIESKRLTLFITR